jgi:orotidine-5'-phosphate decarboxylase
MRTKDGTLKPETIIWSADVPKEDIKAVIKAKALPKGTVIKLDRLFFENEKKSFIDYCENAGYNVFCDAKIVEIPVKTLAIADTYLEHSPFMLNVMAGIVSNGHFLFEEDKNSVDALKRFADACHQAATRSCVVTVLTSKTESICNHEFGMSPIRQVLKYVELAYEAGITDIVCSPKEAAAIRKIKKFDTLTINTPGVRLPGSSKDDQARIMTPYDALSSGADRLVIGRDLTRGEGDITERVKRNYEKILENICPS